MTKPGVVLFIGLTQNGKSSLIQSILNYAGDHEQAKKVQIGTDNLSMTKDVAEYKVVVPRKKHFLRYKDGGSIVGKVEEDLNHDEVEEGEELLGQSVSLRLLDSPGLSDSGQPAPPPGSDVQAPPRQMEDERHKLKVLQALSKVKEINSVCFVIKKHQPFGLDFKRHIQDYIDIFKASSLLEKVHFHVLHTQVDPITRYLTVSQNDGNDSENEYSDEEPGETKNEILWSLARSRTFYNCFKVKATDHWMDNLPAAKNPIAQYFSKSAIAQLVECLGRDSSSKCANLRFPKSERHKIHDKDLHRSYESLMFGLESEMKRLNSEIKDWQRDLRPLTARRDGYKTEIENLDSKIKPLDTKELVEVGADRNRYKESVLFNLAPTLRFRIEASAKIQKIEKTPESPAHGWWDLQSSTDDHYYTDYEANIGYDARASVVLYGYKKDAMSADISKYTKQREGFKDDLKRISERITPIETEIKMAETRITTIQMELAGYKKERSLLDGESFSLQTFNQFSSLFLAGGVYSIYLAYGLETVVSKDKLPKHFLDKLQVSNELWAEKRKQDKLEGADKTVFEALAQDLANKTGLQRNLEKLRSRTEVLCQAVEARFDANKPFEPTLPLNGNSNDISARAIPYVLDTADRLKLQTDEAKALVDGNLLNSYRGLTARKENVTEAIKSVKTLAKKSLELNNEYKKSAQKHGTNAAAAMKTIEILNAEEISIGSFTVLFKGIELKMLNPYMLLYEGVAESLNQLAET